MSRSNAWLPEPPGIRSKKRVGILIRLRPLTSHAMKRPLAHRPLSSQALLFVVILLLLPALASAQDPPPVGAASSEASLPDEATRAQPQQAPFAQRLRGGVKFAVGVPMRGFDELAGDIGYGATGAVRLALRQLPLQVGADLGLLFFDSRLNRGVTVFPGGAGEEPAEGAVRYDTNVFMGHFVTRFQPERAGFSPYVDGLFGFKYLFSDAQIERQLFPGDFDPADAADDLRDWVLSYGAGVGAEIDLSSGSGRSPLGAVTLSGGVRYLFGSDAECIRTGSEGETTCPRTDLLVPQIGVVIGL